MKPSQYNTYVNLKAASKIFNNVVARVRLLHWEAEDVAHLRDQRIQRA